MKWFKHMSDASHGSDLTLLEEEFGLEGYARWFKLLEAVAQNADPKKGRWSCAHPWSIWQQILKGKRKKLETFLEYLQNNLGINQKLIGNILEIEIPNLKKFKDEYSRKSGQDTDSTCARVPEAEADSKKRERERACAPAVDPASENSDPEATAPKKTPYPSKGRPSHNVFKSCLDVYTCGPVNEDEAWVAWCDMEDRGMLAEDVGIIRDQIIMLSSQDDNWLRGYAPSFTKFIKTRGWRDKPFKRPPEQPRTPTQINNALPRATTQAQKNSQDREATAMALLKSEGKLHAGNSSQQRNNQQGGCPSGDPLPGGDDRTGAGGNTHGGVGRVIRGSDRKAVS